MARGRLRRRAIPTDISDPASVRAAVEQVETTFGAMHVLLNVAGAAHVRRVEDASDEDIATVVGTNFVGPIYTTRAAIPLLRRSGGGDIVNVSSEIRVDGTDFGDNFGPGDAETAYPAWEADGYLTRVAGAHQSFRAARASS